MGHNATMMMKSPLILGLLLLSVGTAIGQDSACEERFKLPETVSIPVISAPQLSLDPAIERLVKYMALESRHRLKGLASYYSNSLDGTLTEWRALPHEENVGSPPDPSTRLLGGDQGEGHR